MSKIYNKLDIDRIIGKNRRRELGNGILIMVGRKCFTEAVYTAKETGI